MLRGDLGRHLLRDLNQRSRYDFPVFGRERADRGDQPLGHGHWRTVEHAAAARGQRERLTPPIVLRRDFLHQPPIDETLNDDGDRALMREGQRGQVVDRRARVVRDLLERKKLRARKPRTPATV